MAVRPILAGALLALGAALAGAGDPDDLQPKIDEAIRKGAVFLAGRYGATGGAGDLRARELVVLALLHGGWDRAKSPLREGIEDLQKSALNCTYNVSLTAVALLNLDPARYQARIEQCAQWLVDNQCANGQWSYGDFQVQTPGAGPPKTLATTSPVDPFADRKIDRRLAPRIAVGDNSNTQFAVLGLWAARLARIGVPEATWKAVQELFLKSQSESGGWSYEPERSAAPYLSMTCAGTAALSICGRILKPTHRTEDAIRAGQNWLATNFDVRNPKTGGSPMHYFYALYSLERAGVLLGAERLGAHDWYREGAVEILAAQREDGSWSGEPIDTSFAILFLKRATRVFTKMAGEGERGTVSTPDDELEGK